MGTKGSILILASWALMLLSAMAISLAYGARQKAVFMDRLQSLSSLQMTSYSGVEQARGVLKLMSANPGHEPDTLQSVWCENTNLFKAVKTGGGTFTVGDEKKPGLVDEERKISLNQADAATLGRLLEEMAGLSKDEAEELAFHIVDWRDSDSAYQHASYGAEDQDYHDMRFSYEAKDAPFESVDELLLVKGMTRPIFDRVKDYLTPFGTGAVNVNTAQKEVLAALGLDSAAVDAILAFRRGEDGEDGTADDRFFAQPTLIAGAVNDLRTLSEPQKTAINNLVSAGKLGVLSSFFFAASRAVLNTNGASMVMEAVIDREGHVFYCRASNVRWR